MIRFAETDYGFDWGGMSVERLASDPKFGTVIRVYSKHQYVDVRVSPGGRVLKVCDPQKSYRQLDP